LRDKVGKSGDRNRCHDCCGARADVEQAAEVQREAAARAMALKPVEQDVTVTAATQDAVVLAPQRLAGATTASSICA
jgi:hypothetical protein